MSHKTNNGYYILTDKYPHIVTDLYNGLQKSYTNKTISRFHMVYDTMQLMVHYYFVYGSDNDIIVTDFALLSNNGLIFDADGREYDGVFYNAERYHDCKILAKSHQYLQTPNPRSSIHYIRGIHVADIIVIIQLFTQFYMFEWITLRTYCVNFK
jgi:hypothetical protein